MPPDQTDRDFLKRVYKDLADEPLPPGSPFYQSVYTDLNMDDPVAQLFDKIDFAEGSSIRLFSGFRGSGKTTELRRLQKRLDESYFVLYANALEYVNASEPIDITDLLMVLAGAFSEALERKLGKDIARETYWDRLLRFMNTEVGVQEGTVKSEYQSPLSQLLGGIKVGTDLKFHLKEATNFRHQMRPFLTNKLRELTANVHKFFEDGVKLIKAKQGPDKQVVFIFDQLEQLRGTLQTERAVIESVERIFATHIDLLKIPYVHAVYTVPPWLKFVLPDTGLTTRLSTVHLWHNDADRTPDLDALGAFRDLVQKRLDDDGLLRLFGPAPQRQDRVDRLIGVCGGHVRDLLRVLQDVILRAAALPALPVTDDVITAAINQARRDFLPIAQDDAKWLVQIARIRATALPSTDSVPVNRLTRFLDNHYVLYFINGDEWYDTHPLIRDEVEKVVRATERAAEG